MLLLEPRKLGNELRSGAYRFADEVADRGRDVADRSRAVFHRMTSSRPDPIDQIRTVAGFTVGAVALIGVGYLVTRLVRSRIRSNELRRSRNDGSNRSGGSNRSRFPARREEPTHQLLARLDTPEAIEEHNERVRKMHENARGSSEKVADHSKQPVS